jgi:methylmalonyl-CoA/ethylmalonyl-CoA epimerase
MQENWTLRHVGVVVRNMDEAIEYYQSLGLVTSATPDHILDSKSFEDLKTYGKSGASNWKIKLKMVDIGPLTLEFTEPLEGNNVKGEYLDAIGEGANHIAFAVDDLEKEVEELAKKGIPVMYHAKGQFAYFDTRKVGNVIIELMQRKEMPKKE